ncbi:MAG: RNA-directed DNA polymerase [Ruminococcus sp.]|nr:RNA-directed DNA polymerase [Ruminococcus sp.]
MYIDKDEVIFEFFDVEYVTKHGLEQAMDAAVAFHQKCRLPFLMDISQLAAFLSLDRRELFGLVKRCDTMYRSFLLPKRTGGYRQIDAPAYELTAYQYRILHRILGRIPISRYATAYHRGAALTKNASPHTGKRYLLKIDIKDFFHSVRLSDVHARVFAPYYPKQIGYLLSLLCCKDGRLAQGAPTSPAISNIVMRCFDEPFGEWCEKRGLSYTRYCDDITISGDVPLYRALEKASLWLNNMGFTVNEKKTRFITNASRQTVTGLTVNEKVNVPSDYKRRLRQELYYAAKFGVSSAADYKGLTDAEQYYQSLMGWLNHVLSVEPENESFLKAKQALRERYAADRRI